MNVFLDIMGGVLSLIAEILKVFFTNGEYFNNKTNLPKIGLSIVVMFFDVILIF